MKAEHLHTRITQQSELIDIINSSYENLIKVGLDNVTEERIEARIDSLQETWDKLSIINDAIHVAISRLEKKDRPAIMNRTYLREHLFTTTHDQFLDIKEKMTALRARRRDASTLLSTSYTISQPPALQAPRLPRIDLPKFDGQLDNWLPFRDLFTSLVLSNPSISAVEKLQYLKSSCTGSAAHLLRNTPLTADHFEQAWNSINDYYHNERLLVNSAIQSLFSIKSMTRECFSEMELLYTSILQVVQNLQTLGRPVDQWDDLLVYMMVQRLDPESTKAWEHHLGSSRSPPSWAQFREFLLARLLSLQALEKSKPPRPLAVKTHVISGVADHALGAAKSNHCILCSSDHKVSQCSQYKLKSIDQKWTFVRDKRLCYNCLGFHQAAKCQSIGRCLNCGKKHHTSLHNKFTPSNDTAIVNHVLFLSNARPSIVFLATAQVDVVNHQGEVVTIRALLDQGSEITLVSENLIQLLNIQREKSSISVTGVGASDSGRTRGVADLVIKPHFESPLTIDVRAHILPKLTSSIPSVTVSHFELPYLRGLSLADPEFRTSGVIDLIIEADLYGELINGSIVRGPKNYPIAQSTVLGWVVSGPCPSDDATRSQSAVYHCSVDHDMQSVLERFWLQEEIRPQANHVLSADDKACMDHFQNTVSRDDSGRYTVRLPFKHPTESLGNSKAVAIQMLNHLEKKFASSPSFYNEYSSFLKEYETLDHMRRVSSAESETEAAFYLPHHGVVRESSTSTKLRVVFNGSCKVSNGLSLNDSLYSGPKLQLDLVDVLIWQRSFQYLFNADIKMMYRQINVSPEDWRFQQILWRESQSLVAFQLKTVTYGLSCAPILALRSLQQLYSDEGDKFPLAKEPMLKGRYVDDICGRADSIEEARAQALQVNDLCLTGGFPLRKWVSNHPLILKDFSPDFLAGTDSVSINDYMVHNLGLLWKPSSDTFHFCLKDPAINKLTKRAVLSRIAQFFDPLGLLSPIFITAKVFMQELWAIKVTWDEELPHAQSQSWLLILKNLEALGEIHIPRWIETSSDSSIEIHGFCDASQTAMAAAVYIRSTRNGVSRSVLLCSKTKVAPLKRTTIPRLELLAAVLLTRLIAHCQKVLNIETVPLHMWTDSSIVFTWINSHPSRWRDFVHNRVCLIQESLPRAQWKHISGTENPADCATRGLSAAELRGFRPWWSGPKWLTDPEISWPRTNVRLSDKQSLHLEEKPKHSHQSLPFRHESFPWILISRLSSLTKLLRVTAILERARQRFRGIQDASLSRRPLEPSELQEALVFWIRATQAESFRTEISILTSQKERPHNLLRLLPFLDDAGLLRVGGRLKHSPLPYESKHPCILPRNSSLTTLMIRDAHLKTLHGSTQETLSQIRQSCWIIGGRAPIRSYILKCTKCIRYRRHQAQQLMGQLPPSRVTPSRAFLHTGVDYAGPFDVKTWKGRNARTYKAWVSVFVCFSTSAVHLELVTDYSADAFIAAYRRFCARRGTCATLISDCGTNFIGANKELQKLFAKHSEEFKMVIDSLTSHGTKWEFNPPGAPHFGEKWEAAVKSMKYHLRRVIGDQHFTYEELTTFLVQIEAVLNSRPLCPLTEDPDDLQVLTPGHFLVGHALTLIPEPNLMMFKECGLKRWQRLQRMIQQFWALFVRSYLQRHLTLYKWNKRNPDLAIGTIVLLIDERSPPAKWPLARVLEVFPGSDGVTRVAKVQLGSVTKTRPIVKLCPLVLPSDTAEYSSPASSKAAGNV